jgi:hypothetical protein
MARPAPTVSGGLRYEWTGPDADALRQIEQAVLAELREWSE